MESTKNRKQRRVENNLKKVKALLDISTMNERDREAVAAFKRQKLDGSDSGASFDAGEPAVKKCKAEDGSAISPPDNNEDGNAAKLSFTEEQKAELRKLLKQRRDMLKHIPRFHLKEAGFQAELCIHAADRVPIFCSDIQHLVMHALFSRNVPNTRWFSFDKVGAISNVQILLVEGAGISDYLKCQNSLTELSVGNFQTCLEVVMPAAYRGDLIEELCLVPLSNNQGIKLMKMYRSLESAHQKAGHQLFKVLRTFFPITKAAGHDGENPDVSKNENNLDSKKDDDNPAREEDESDSSSESDDDNPAKQEDESDSSECDDDNPILQRDEDDSSGKTAKDNEEIGDEEHEENLVTRPAIASKPLPPSDKFPRTSLLLSAWQLIEEGYPIILNEKSRTQFKNFVYTKTSYKEVNDFSPMYGIDCEMCMTTAYLNECTRVSIVNEKLETVYDTLVLPYNRITNYLTEFSGITKQMMKNVTTRLEDVQKFIQERLEPDAILVGQSLNFDLKAIKMLHPYCIDTSVIFNVTGNRYRKTKLKHLTEHFLKESIQTGTDGHDSVEDSSASLRLVQLKLSKSLEFGDEILSQGTSGEVSADQVTIRQVAPKKPRVKTPRVPINLSGYASSLFHYTATSNQHVTITACPDVVEKYIDYVDPTILSCKELGKDGNCGAPIERVGSQVTCFVARSNDDVMERVPNQGEALSIYHIQLAEQEQIGLSTGDQTSIDRLNQWVSRLKNSAPNSSLSIVVLCGREMSSNGVGFVRVNTKLPPPLIYRPESSGS